MSQHNQQQETELAQFTEENAYRTAKYMQMFEQHGAAVRESPVERALQVMDAPQTQNPSPIAQSTDDAERRRYEKPLEDICDQGASTDEHAAIRSTAFTPPNAHDHTLSHLEGPLRDRIEDAEDEMMEDWMERSVDQFSPPPTAPGSFRPFLYRPPCLAELIRPQGRLEMQNVTSADVQAFLSEPQSILGRHYILSPDFEDCSVFYRVVSCKITITGFAFGIQYEDDVFADEVDQPQMVKMLRDSVGNVPVSPLMVGTEFL
ncbi:hypothetical protein BU15DRAFT_66106 [Melanogaster broomeanus]|nr:hypothetical protein BU15DRAFT_66106 [Melanogaster broomeanus]